MKASPVAISPTRITLLLAGLISIMPFAIDAYLPAMAALANDLNASVHLLEQSMSSFFLGIAVGQLTGAPFSDRLGRRTPILVGLAIFIVASAVLIQVSSSEALISWRFIQAFGAGVAVVGVGPVVRDLFDEVGTAKMFANMAMVMMIAPLISPLIGAYLLELFGWPSIFVFLAGYGAVVLATIYSQLPESRDLRATPIQTNGYRHVLSSLWSNVLVVSLGLAGVCFFMYLADSSFIFLEFYALSPTQFAWLFASGVLTLVVAHRINAWLLTRFKPRRILLKTFPLQSAAAIILFSYTYLGANNMWMFFSMIMLVACFTQIINSNGLAIYLALHPNHAGKANAIWGSVRFGLAGIFGVGLVKFHSQSPMTFAILLLVAALSAMALFHLCRSQSEIFSLGNTQ